MFYLYLITKLMLIITDRIQINNKYLHRLLNMMEKAKAVTDESTFKEDILQKCHKLNIKGDLRLFWGGWLEAISYEGYCFRFMLTTFQFIVCCAVLLKEATIRHYCPQKKVNFRVHTPVKIFCDHSVITNHARDHSLA